MTTSQHLRQVGASSPVRRALGRSLRALRDLHHEQVYAWQCFFRSGLAPQPRTQTPAAARGGHAVAGSGSAVPADVDNGDRAA